MVEQVKEPLQIDLGNPMDAPNFLVNPNAPWDTIFMLPDFGFEELMCWHFACLIPNDKKSGKPITIPEKEDY